MLSIILCIALALGLFWSPVLSAASKQTTSQIPTPVVNIRERSFKDLAQFGKQVRAYTLQLGYRRLIVGVRLIRNLTGISEALPWDLTDYVVDAISKLGPQFVAYREHNLVAAPTGGMIAPVPQSNPPAVDFWINGSLEAVTKAYKADTKNGVTGTGGGGHTQFDLGLNRNHARTVTSVTVTLNVEGPDKLSIPGASATYRAQFSEDQKQTSISFFLGGSGLTHDSTVTTAENFNSDDAIFSVTAASLIACLGNVLEVPYYVISSVFPPDRQLDMRVRDRMAQLTTRDIQKNLKFWLIAEGYPLALNALDHLTDHDQAIVEVEMSHRSLPFTRDGYADFLLATWREMKFETACDRVVRYLAAAKAAADEAVQQKQEREAAEAAAKQAAEAKAKEAAEAAAKQQLLEQQQKKASQTAKPGLRRHAVAHRRQTAKPCVTPASRSGKP